MTNPLKRIYAADGSFEDVEMTDEEARDFAEWQAQRLAEAEERLNAIEAAEAEKAAQRAAILERLGLTEDEAKLILG